MTATVCNIRMSMERLQDRMFEIIGCKTTKDCIYYLENEALAVAKILIIVALSKYLVNIKPTIQQAGN